MEGSTFSITLFSFSLSARSAGKEKPRKRVWCGGCQGDISDGATAGAANWGGLSRCRPSHLAQEPIGECSTRQRLAPVLSMLILALLPSLPSPLQLSARTLAHRGQPRQKSPAQQNLALSLRLQEVIHITASFCCCWGVPSVQGFRGRKNLPPPSHRRF